MAWGLALREELHYGRTHHRILPHLVKPYHIEGIEALISHHTQDKNWLLHDSQTGIVGISLFSPIFEGCYLNRDKPKKQNTQAELPA